MFVYNRKMNFIFMWFCMLLLLKYIEAQNFYNNVAQVSCAGGSVCTKLTGCGLLNDLIQRTCISASSFRSLTCGYIGTEPMLCCPQGGRQSLVPQKRNYNWQPPSNNPSKNIQRECGVTRLRGATTFSEIGAQPWAARIGFASTKTDEIKYPCGGSIISKRVVLTAAHCVLAKSPKYKLNNVLVGEWNTDTDLDCGEEFCGLPAQLVPISHIITHPGYQQDNSFRDNLALIILKEDINFTVTAQPICIFEQQEQLIGDFATLIGWGKLAGQAVLPSIQQSLTVPILPMDKCREVYNNLVPLGTDKEQICAGGVEGQDACAGFGGSPLVKKDRHSDSFYQVGLLSFGADKCGVSGVPSIYVNINNYARWIRENTPLFY